MCNFKMGKCSNGHFVVLLILVTSASVNCTAIFTNIDDIDDTLYHRNVSINDGLSKNITVDLETDNAEILDVDRNDTILQLFLFNESTIEYDEPIALPILDMSTNYSNDRSKRSRSTYRSRNCKTSPYYRQGIRHSVNPADPSKQTKKRRRPPPPIICSISRRGRLGI